MSARAIYRKISLEYSKTEYCHTKVNRRRGQKLSITDGSWGQNCQSGMGSLSAVVHTSDISRFSLILLLRLVLKLVSQPAALSLLHQDM